MSACISSEGEYSDHTLDDAYMCTRCYALDEDSMTRDLLASRVKLAAIRALMAAQWVDHPPQASLPLAILAILDGPTP